MAEHQHSRGERDGLQTESQQKKKTRQPVYDQRKTSDRGGNNLIIPPSANEQANLQAGLSSDNERADLAIQLQEAYGNAYVQRIMERIQNQKSSVKPLNPEARYGMEASFGEDLGSVRIHENATASDLTSELGAQAFTAGKDIFFKDGAYEPGYQAGNRLLVYELTHVLQQERNTPSESFTGQAHSALEQEAVLAGQVIGEGREIAVGSASAVPLIQRADDDEEETPVEHTAPEDADLLIGAAYGDSIVDAICRGVSAAASIVVADEATTRAAWIAKYGSDADSMADYADTNAWVDRSTTPPTVYVRETRGNPGTVIHESMHLYSNLTVRDTYGTNVNEGMTEYFTRIITDILGIARSNYREQVEEVTELAGVVGDSVLRAAYFEGEIASLESTVDAVVEEDAFYYWTAYMQASDWSGARGALHQVAATP